MEIIKKIPEPQIVEDENTYKVYIEGELIISIEYNSLIDKWHIKSDVLPIIDEKWDYDKNEKDLVKEEALLLMYVITESKACYRRSRKIQVYALIAMMVLVGVSILTRSLVPQILYTIINAGVAIYFLVIAKKWRRTLYYVTSFLYLLVVMVCLLPFL